MSETPDIEKIIFEYIDKSIHMSLATVSGDRPWVCEAHFVYDAQLNLYWRSLASRRHSQEIISNSNVAGNIVRQHSLEEYPHAVYFEGTAELLDDIEQQRMIFPLFQTRLSAEEGIIEEAQQEDGHKFYKITVNNWYAFGRFGRSEGLKYKLVWDGGKK